MILDLHRQGLSVSAIARQCCLDRKTVRRYIERGLEPPAYGKRRSGTTWALKLRARSDQAVTATFCVAYAQGSSSSRRL